MNFNKYLIAIMITVGVAKTAIAQNVNNKNAVKSQQSYTKSKPDPIAMSTRQTQEMKRELALNESQVEKVKKINYNHAREIEVAKVECGDDVTGFNSYVDRVSVARDQQLKSVLTPEQFASYTSKKNDKNWLGIDQFKYKSADGNLKVKNNKNELKIKGVNPNANVTAGEDLSVKNKSDVKEDESSDAYTNNNNIMIDSSETGAVPEINIDTNTDRASVNPGVERVKPEYDNMYSDSGSASAKSKEKECKETTKSGSTKMGTTPSKSSVKSTKAKTSKAPSSGAVASKSKVKKTTTATKSGNVQKKTSATAKSGNVQKKKKSTTSASAKKKAKADTSMQGSSRIEPVMPDTTASSSNPERTPDSSFKFRYPFDTTGSSRNPNWPDTSAKIFVMPDTTASSSEPALMDTTTSASTKSQNYFMDKDSKAKFSRGESKIKPNNHNKMKETDGEVKSKDGHDKVKEERNESKVKDKDLKVKITK
jgi:hypothetical protein